MNIRYAFSRLSPNVRVILLVVLVASLTIGIVAAAGYLMTSNTATVNVADQATLALTVSTGSIVVGDTVTIQVTCSDSSFSGPITIKANNAVIATPTASGGVASYVWTVTTAGSYTLQATAQHA